MDNERQAALDTPLSDRTTRDEVVIERAARKVANPDYEAAVSVMWDREPYLESKEENMRRAVDAALGITE